LPRKTADIWSGNSLSKFATLLGE